MFQEQTTSTLELIEMKTEVLHGLTVQVKNLMCLHFGMKVSLEMMEERKIVQMTAESNALLLLSGGTIANGMMFHVVNNTALYANTMLILRNVCQKHVLRELLTTSQNP